MSTVTPLISLSHIGYRDGETRILSDIDMVVNPREILTIIGPNGAGKTTLLKIVLGILKPTEGTIARRAGLSIGYMPQKIRLPKMMPMTVKRFLRLDADYSFSVLAEALSAAGLTVPADRDVRLLSGGEMQRLLFARALLRKPELLVLDEPAQGLDAAGEDDFYALLQSLNKQAGCAVLMVSHDLHVVMAQTDGVICLNNHICCRGKPADIAENKVLETLFGKKTHLAPYAHRHVHAEKGGDCD